MDVLSDILRACALSRVVYGQKRLRGPWGVRSLVDAYLLHVVLEGECWLTTGSDGVPERLHTGDLVLVKGGIPHCLQDALDSPVVDITEMPALGGQSVPQDATDVCNLLCSGYRLQAHPMLSLVPPVCRLTTRSGPASELLKSAVSCIVQETEPGIETRGPGAQALVDQLSGILLTEFVRAHFSDVSKMPFDFRVALVDPQIGVALSAIHGAPEQVWGLSRLARTAGMSRSSFSVKFKSLTGETAGSYLARWRMHCAAELMRRSAPTVHEVMQHVGYSSEATFSRAFKRYLGVAPATYGKGIRAAERGSETATPRSRRSEPSSPP